MEINKEELEVVVTQIVHDLGMESHLKEIFNRPSVIELSTDKVYALEKVKAVLNEGEYFHYQDVKMMCTDLGTANPQGDYDLDIKVEYCDKNDRINYPSFCPIKFLKYIELGIICLTRGE